MTDLVPESRSDRTGAPRMADALSHVTAAEDSGAAELQLLQWVFSLPAGLDPAIAARALIESHHKQQQPGLSSRLLELLETVAAYPAERLGRIRRRRRSAIGNLAD